MNIQVQRVEVDDIVALRDLHRRELNCQIVHDSFPRRGFSDPYLLQVNGRVAGYGLVSNKYYPDTVGEFYTIPAYRKDALPLFRQLLETSNATRIRAQTNDRLLTLMLYDCAVDIESDVILFEDSFTSHLPSPGGAMRKVAPDEKAIFEHKNEPVGEWMIEYEGVAAATGGALYHYNPPYGDIYMEVNEKYRQRGFGSYLVQELKRVTYEVGKVPAARCSASNIASRRTLQKAGLLPCARILEGAVKTPA